MNGETPSFSIRASQDRARIVFDCRAANDPAMMRIDADMRIRFIQAGATDALRAPA
jgi:hypothetical protein